MALVGFWYKVSGLRRRRLFLPSVFWDERHFEAPLKAPFLFSLLLPPPPTLRMKGGRERRSDGLDARQRKRKRKRNKEFVFVFHPPFPFLLSTSSSLFVRREGHGLFFFYQGSFFCLCLSLCRISRLNAWDRR